MITKTPAANHTGVRSLLIGIPWSEGFNIQKVCAISVEHLMGHLRSGDGPPALRHFEKHQSGAFPTDVARNEICRFMLTKDFTHLLFLDADHVVPKDLVDRLAAHGKDIITARYHVRRPPYHANIYVDAPDNPPGCYKPVHYGEGCFEIDRAGAGALLISRRVIQAFTDAAEAGSESFFRYQPNPNAGEPNDFSVSEDFHFFERAQALGFSCWVDWDVEVGHLSQMIVGAEQCNAYLDTMASNMTGDLATHLISCGVDEPIDIGGHTVEPFRRSRELMAV